MALETNWSGEVAYDMDVVRARGVLTPYSRLEVGGLERALGLGTEFSLMSQSADARPFTFGLERLR